MSTENPTALELADNLRRQTAAKVVAEIDRIVSTGQREGWIAETTVGLFPLGESKYRIYVRAWFFGLFHAAQVRLDDGTSTYVSSFTAEFHLGSRWSDVGRAIRRLKAHRLRVLAKKGRENALNVQAQALSAVSSLQVPQTPGEGTLALAETSQAPEVPGEVSWLICENIACRWEGLPEATDQQRARVGAPRLCPKCSGFRLTRYPAEMIVQRDGIYVHVSWRDGSLTRKVNARGERV